MKNLRLFAFMIILMAVMTITVCAYPAKSQTTLKNVCELNYKQYVKPITAEYGFNKGEAKVPHLFNEEYFYSKYIDHWNVDVVYDKKIAHSKKALKWRKNRIKSYKKEMI